MKKLIRTSKPTLNEEKRLWGNEYDFVIGIDEVGRGAFAGPVTVAAVIFNKKDSCTKNILEEVNDSKLLTPQKREKLDKEIRNFAQFHSIATVGVSIINKVGIGKATSMAFRKAITNIINEVLNFKNLTNGNLLKIPERKKFFVLVDGFHIKYIRGIGLKHQKAIIKGDQKSISIAAASIIAKVYRDNLMKELGKKYPQYHFEVNKGYGTREHRETIKKHGLSKVHRKSFNLSGYLPDLKIP